MFPSLQQWVHQSFNRQISLVVHAIKSPPVLPETVIPGGTLTRLFFHQKLRLIKMNILIYGYNHITSSIWPGSLSEPIRLDADHTKKFQAPKIPKMIKSPIFKNLGPRYHFLTTRKVISDQKYNRNTQRLKNMIFS